MVVCFTRLLKGDKSIDIKNRIKRCIKESEKGRDKKADMALNDGKVANLYINNNWKKTQDKFPEGNDIKYDDNEPKPKFNLKESDTKEILRNLNSKSKGGKIGINNDFTLWMVDNDDIYEINKSIYNLTKEIVINGIPEVVRTLMTHAGGLPLGKEKDGIPDHGIRPIVIMDSIIRIIDKLTMDNVPKKDRRSAMGEYQMIGIKAGCEIATVGMDFALKFIEEYDEFGMVNIDAKDAYSSMDQQQIYKSVCNELPDFLNAFKFLYGKDIICDLT